MSKVNKHQIYFIFFSLIVLFLFAVLDIMFIETLNTESSDLSLLIMVISLTLISTIGVAHGALDGKIIWKHSTNGRPRLKLYVLYLLLALCGALLWFIYPFAGLILLLGMSSIHFGVSDLKFIKEMTIAPKLFWGFVMTFLPLLFKPKIVNSIFFDLTQVNIPLEILEAIKIIILFSIFGFFICLYLLAKNRKKMGNSIYELILLGTEIVVLVCLAYYLTPLMWFAIYFCGLHGIRALIDCKFKIVPDILWLALFTGPVLVIIFMIDWEYNSNSLLIVFPILASLTIAHMLLPSLKMIVKP